jgi:hypothetical protein
MCCIIKVFSSLLGAKRSRALRTVSPKNSSKESKRPTSQIESPNQSGGSTTSKILWLLAAWFIACFVQENYSLWLLNTAILSAILADALLWHHNPTGDRFALTKGALCVAAFTLVDEYTVLLEDEYLYAAMTAAVGIGSWAWWMVAEMRKERMRVGDGKIKRARRKFRVKAKGIKVSIRSLEIKA